MNKSELIQRIQQAAVLYRQDRYYEAFQLIEPVHRKVRHDKVVKLFTASRRKVLHALQQLTEENRPSRIVELSQQFFTGIDDPEIRLFVEEAEKAVARQQKKEPLEISIDDIHPDMEDPVTEIISESWIRGMASDETVSDVEPESSHPAEGDPKAPITAEAIPAENESASEGSGDLDINELIQRGVSLYEVGDVLNAMKTWEHGLTFDPDNVILKEYIANARRELDAELEETVPAEPESPAASPAATPAGPMEPLDQTELNQIIATARAGEVEQAIRNLDALATRCGPLPQIAEARKYLESLAQEYGVSTAVARARQLIEEKKAREAVRLLEDQANHYPDNEQLRSALEHARKRMMEEPPPEQSLELDFDAKGERPVETPRPPVVPVEPARKRRGRSKPVVMRDSGNLWKMGLIAGVIVIIALAVVWLVLPRLKLKRFTSRMQQQTAQTETNRKPTSEDRETTRLRERKTTVQQARDMFNRRRYLFAYYLFLHAESLAPLTDDEQQFLAAARSEMSSRINERTLKRRADQAFRKGDFQTASEIYYRLLSVNPDNIAYKKRLFRSYELMGVQLAFQGMAEQAREFFTYAQILEPGNKIIQKHQRVITRYISGIISRNQLKEWFFFFL